MKNTYLLILLSCLISFTSSAQQANSYFFEPPYNSYVGEFVLDSTNYTGCWQIGRPQKSTFDSASSYPNAIVTDTLNPYPVNDTSYFLFKIDVYHHNPIGGNWYIFSGIQFRYKLDIDSGEIAKVEIATDSGKYWLNLLDLDSAYDVYWNNAKPDLSTPTNTWKTFSASFLSWSFGSYDNDTTRYPHIINGDSTYIRFTFISDSVQTNKDGWMIDNLYIYQYSENIDHITSRNLISIYPNPASNYIYIKANYTYYAQPVVSITDMQGRIVMPEQNVPADGLIYLNLPPGIYMLKYSTDKEVTVKQLVISE